MLNKAKYLKLLLSKNILPNKDFEEILPLIKEDPDFDIDSYLLKQKLSSREDITKIKAEVYNLPYIDLHGEIVPDDTLHIISEELSSNYSVICFFLDQENKIMNVGLTAPDLKAMEAVNFLANEKKYRVKYYLISDSSFRYIFSQYSKMEEEVLSALETKSKEEGKEEEDEIIQVKQDEVKTTLDAEDANSAPVAKIVSVVIKNAINNRASDIHIEPFEKESRVRYRIDGILKNALFLPKNIHGSVIARIKVMAKMKLDETRIPQDGRIVLVLNGREIDFRISTLPIGDGLEKVVMRILDTDKSIITMEELGFNNYILEVFYRNIKKTNGIVLVTGPTGSGKTTTLYSVLNILNKEGVNISTLEDPIEYHLKGVNQSQVRPKIGYNFSTGLRSLVRQDPDVIMVGEIRDEETVELSIHASLTGHLVLSTIHTNDALSTIFRLLDMKAEPVLLCSILRMIIAQRLVRKLCVHCKQEVASSDNMEFLNEAYEFLKDLNIEMLQKEIPELRSYEDIKNIKTFAPVGCSKCQNSGYFERVSIGEIIEIDNNLKDLIMTRANTLKINDVKKSQNFVSLKQDGYIKILQGLTNLDEVLRVVEM